MNIRTTSVLIKPLIVLTGCVLAFHLSTANSTADTLFSEDFDGYTSFPGQEPLGDYVNFGIPEISEGADALWFGARFQNQDTNNLDPSIDGDLFVQRFGDWTGTTPGSFGNVTPVGRFADDAGLVLRIDTTGYSDVTLDFDWRTAFAGTGDKFTVGYYVGEIGFNTGANRYMDLRSSGPNSAYSWSHWTQLMSQGDGGYPFEHETFLLPAADDAGVVYVAFWLDNGNDDYGKVDNISITGNPLLVPEPTTMSLGLLGLALVIARRRSVR